MSYRSESISEIAKALSAFQAVVPTIPKNKEVSFYSKKINATVKYAYSPYDTIIENIKKPLKDNGLSFTQLVVGDELITMLIHVSGEWFKTTMKLTSSPADQQSYGSDITYKRRYSLSAILGIATDEDDDGLKAQDDQLVVAQNTTIETKQKKVVLTKASKGWQNAINSYKEHGNLDLVKQFAEVSPEVEAEIIAICEASKPANNEQVEF